MELLKEIYDNDIGESSGSYFGVNYKIRKAMRAVIFDDEKKIALMRVKSDNYYKLPGGGIDEGEDYQEALKRELLEETGCDSRTEDEVGITIEYRNQFEMLQISYCYLSNVVGDKGTVDFTQKELDDGFELIWVDLVEAIDLVKNSTPKKYACKFIVLRDLILLEKAKKILNN